MTTDEIKIPHPKIQILEEDINKACRRDHRNCMLVLAIKRQLPNVEKVTVDLMTIRFSDPEKGLRFVYHTPQSGKEALAHFDQGDIVKPFGMRLGSGHATSLKKGGQRIHKFGLPSMEIKNRPTSTGGIERTDTVGGTTAPVQRPRHPSHSSVRVFGYRGWTSGWEFKGDRSHLQENDQNKK